MSAIARLDAVAERLGRPALWGRIAARIVGFIVAIIGAGLLLGASVSPVISVANAAVDMVGRDLLTFPPLPDSIGERPERSIVRARNGEVLAVLHGVENRKLVELERIPKHVQDAVIATEDSAFWRHTGVNWRAIVRAYVGNMQAGEVQSGASTITQQLVKQVVLQDTSQTYERKLREAHYATLLEQRLSKEQILGEYLNLAYFAHGIYGIGTAAEFYFDKPVGQLTVREGAMLAGMIRAPEINDPIDRPMDAIGRRNIVLRQMATLGFITPDEADRLSSKGLGLHPAPKQPEGKSFFVTYVTELLKQQPALGETRQARAEAILRGGLRIRTTLDPGLQEHATDAIKSVLKVRNGPQAALTALDPRTGEILAIGVGPREFGKGKNRSQVTPAVPGLGSPAGRQPGSSFKAFELVAALEDGISPAYTFNAQSRYTFTETTCNPPDYSPANYADASLGVLDMGDAIAKSSNTYFAHLADLTGPERLTETAHRMGISTDLVPYCSAVLGTQEVFGLDMASGYGTLANKGEHCEPYAITEVRDRHDRILMRNTPTCSPAVQPGIAATATDLLRGPIEFGTATLNGQIGRPAAGKTGTTDNYGNAWFVGYVPQLVASTWIGHPGETKPLYDARCSGGQVTGGCLPTMIWSKFMRSALKGEPVMGFPDPPALPKAEVPSVVGRLLVEAKEILADAQFQVRTETVASYEPLGTVVAQRPKAGTTIEQGTAVVLAVSDGTAPAPGIPDLVGLTEAAASARLAEAGLLGRAQDVAFNDPLKWGLVVTQSPPAGTPIDEAGDIIVYIGAPPPDDPSEDPDPDPDPQPSPSPSPSQEPDDKPGKGRGRP